MGRWRWAVGALLLCAGCFSPSKEGEARLAQVEAQGKSFDAALDRVEGRLLEDQSNVHLWAEMAWRHQHVSALAATNAGFHREQIAAIAERAAAKARALKAGKLAAAIPERGVGGPKLKALSRVTPASARPAPSGRRR
jgi:hypothetical protein